MRASESAAFISYSRDDSEFALKLAQDLKQARIPVWLDQLDIDAGHEWDQAIEAALAHASKMLIILSPSSASSRNVRNEITYALDEDKVIVPILYRDCIVPLQLRRIQHLDFRTNYTKALTELKRSMAPADGGMTMARAVAMMEPENPAPREVLFNILHDGQTYGPYTLADIKRYLASGNISWTDLISKSQGVQHWVPLLQFFR